VAKIKKTRKELLKEPDEFITTTGKLIQWAIKNQTRLTYGLAVVVIVALGISTYRFFSLRAEAQAAQLLQQAMTKYEKLRADKPPAEVYGAVSEDFQTILDKYGSKKSGKLAGLRFANISYDAGELKKAVALYEKALPQFELFPLLHDQILNDLAMANFQLGEDKAAIGYFEEIVADAKSVNKDEALFHLGSLYARTGQKDRSRAAYDRLLSEFENSSYKDLVPKPTNG
jgi:predicted negative regulator of RcsB-dependent stress response